jgi:sarcosine oxidase, subunit gamma
MDKLIARSTVNQDFVDSQSFPIAVSSLNISELPLGGIVRIQGRSSDPAFAAGVTTCLGVTLPAPESLARGNSCVLAWAGPNEYLWFCDLAEEGAFVASLTGALTGVFANVTLVSDSRIGFLVRGVEARSFLAKGCSIDMHATAFGAGQVVTTRFAGLPAMLLSREEDEFVIYFDIGHAQYVLKWISDAAEEFVHAAT